MRTFILAALVALPVLVTPAFADGGRMNALEFKRANRCLAYASLDALRGDGADFSALQQRFDAAFATRDYEARRDAAQEAREIRVGAKDSTSDREIAALRSRRDHECRSFAVGAAAKAEAPASGD